MALAEYNRLDKDLSPMQERVAELQAAGCTPAQIASATGYSLSYISELGRMAKFKELVVNKSGRRIERELELKDRYESLENSLLKGIRERAATADMSELSRALDVVAKNNPRRASKGLGVLGDGGNNSNAVVSLRLPEHVQASIGIELKTNARNEVVEIDGREMLPLTAQEIQSRIASRNE